jgi:transcriptional regulator with XRE-family HTH domain
MSDLFQNLKTEFQNEDYRYAYAESFLNTKLATQIKTLREQRQKTQAEIATKMGIKQPGYRRFEDCNHAVWRTDSLWNIARVYGVRLNISFETFGTLPEEKERFTREALKRPTFEDDPAFKDQVPEESGKEVAAEAGIAASRHFVTARAGEIPWLGNSQEVAAQVIADHYPGRTDYLEPATQVQLQPSAYASAIRVPDAGVPRQATEFTPTAGPQATDEGIHLIHSGHRRNRKTPMKGKYGRSGKQPRTETRIRTKITAAGFPTGTSAIAGGTAVPAA